jgi:RecB family exonuclease
MPSDERAGLPSASGFSRYALCAGSFALEKQCPPLAESKEARRGSRIHAALAGLPVDPRLTEDEADVLAECQRLTMEVTDGILGGDADEIRREERLWFSIRADTQETLLFSGQFDYYARRGDKALVLDYKTGMEAIVAEESWQLRALVALAVHNLLVKPEDELTVGIIQPAARSKVRLVVYDEIERQEALNDARDLARLILMEGHARTPSEAACQYCRAQSVCEEAQVALKAMSVLSLKTRETKALIDGATLAGLLDILPRVWNISRAIVGQAREMLSNNPHAIPGYCLREGVMREKIVNVAGVWKNAEQLGIGPEDFTRACSLTKKGTRQLLRESLGAKGQGLEDKMKWMIAGNVESKETTPRVLKVGSPDTDFDVCD